MKPMSANKNQLIIILELAKTCKTLEELIKRLEEIIKQVK